MPKHVEFQNKNFFVYLKVFLYVYLLLFFFRASQIKPRASQFLDMLAQRASQYSSLCQALNFLSINCQTFCLSTVKLFVYQLYLLSILDFDLYSHIPQALCFHYIRCEVDCFYSVHYFLLIFNTLFEIKTVHTVDLF